jgi:hypothetical protein
MRQRATAVADKLGDLWDAVAYPVCVHRNGWPRRWWSPGQDQQPPRRPLIRRATLERSPATSPFA